MWKDEKKVVQKGIISADVRHGIQAPKGVGKEKRKNVFFSAEGKGAFIGYGSRANYS